MRKCVSRRLNLHSLGSFRAGLTFVCLKTNSRFGIDFLYPVERYVQAFTSATVTTASGQIMPNPLFSDLDTSDDVTATRDPGLVVFAGILGVPWQDIAKNPDSHTGRYLADML